MLIEAFSQMSLVQDTISGKQAMPCDI